MHPPNIFQSKCLTGSPSDTVYCPFAPRYPGALHTCGFPLGPLSFVLVFQHHPDISAADNDDSQTKEGENAGQSFLDGNAGARTDILLRE